MDNPPGAPTLWQNVNSADGFQARHTLSFFGFLKTFTLIRLSCTLRGSKQERIAAERAAMSAKSVSIHLTVLLLNCDALIAVFGNGDSLRR